MRNTKTQSLVSHPPQLEAKHSCISLTQCAFRNLALRKHCKRLHSAFQSDIKGLERHGVQTLFFHGRFAQKKLFLIRFSNFISHPPLLGLGLHPFVSLRNSITSHWNE